MKRNIGKLFLFVFLSILISCEPEDFNIDSDDPRDKIADTWNVTEYGLLDTISYLSDISKHFTDSTKVRINYFYGLGFDADAIGVLSGTNIEINEQTLKGIKLKGNGSISSNYRKINFNFTADDGSGFVDQVKAVYTR